jgi:hypothetical protein
LSLYHFLTRRQTIVLPSIASTLVFFIVFCGIFYAAFINLARFLSPEQLYGRGIFVVGGWLHEVELRKAYEIYQQGDYDQLLVVGMPTEQSEMQFETHAERGAWYFRSFGLPENQLMVLPVPSSDIGRSYVAILTVRNWLQMRGELPEILDIASSYAHSRRTRGLYRRAFSSTHTKIGAITLPNPRYQLEGWWRQSHSAKKVISEFSGWLYTVCCFDAESLEQRYRELSEQSGYSLPAYLPAK